VIGKCVVVMPTYNAASTLKRTVRELTEIFDATILVDERSTDGTAPIAKNLDLKVFLHDRNYGYGRNQQILCREALADEADGVVMVHPDYQYTPLLETAVLSMITCGYDAVLGSKILGGGARMGGIPLHKYFANRMLTAFHNVVTGAKLSKYHAGFCPFSKAVLLNLPLVENSDDFVFDKEILAQCIHFGYRIGEAFCPTNYFDEASSINFVRNVRYGFGVLHTSLKLLLQRRHLAHYRLFSPSGKKLLLDYYWSARLEMAENSGLQA
jgi:glycosyltransferase involved in cell wall biosynthesis